MKGSKTYVYALKDADGNIIKVGKSICPYKRLTQYNNSTYTMEILDIYEDVENFWIKKLLSEGHKLQNREMNVSVEEWEIGDVIQMKKVSTQKRGVYDTMKKITYEGFQQVCYALRKEGIYTDGTTLKKYITRKVKPSKKNIHLRPLINRFQFI